MSTLALLLVAFVVGWITTVSLVRDLRRLELADFLIAASGAFCSAFVFMPRMGLAVWGDYGLRLETLCVMTLAAASVLVVANLMRGRGIRAGKLCLQRAVLSPSQTQRQFA